MNIFWGRKVGDNRIKHRLNPFILVCRPKEYRHQLQTEGTDSNSIVNHLLCGCSFQNSLHQFFRIHGGCIKEFLPLCLCLIPKFSRNLSLSEHFTIGTFKINSLHGHQVNNTFQVSFKTNGDLQHNGIKVKFIPDLLGHPVRISTCSITFIDKNYSRYFIASHLAINSDTLGLNSTHRT